MNFRSTSRSVRLILALFLLLSSWPQVSGQDGSTPFRSIFNGVNLAGWDGNSDFWRVEDGTITGETTAARPTKGNTFIIWRGGELDDFDLRLEYRIVGGNSGIQYRSFTNEAKWGKWVVGGYQADFEAGDTFSGILYGERYRGVLGLRGEHTVIGKDHKPRVVGTVGDTVELQSHIKKEDWNEYRIVARGHHFTHRINGKLMVDVIDEDMEMRRRSGVLAFQLHAGPPMKVQFRNIRLRRLKMEDRKKIVLVAGRRSHGYGSHEHNAGCLLLKKCLDENISGVHATVYLGGWPYPVAAKPDGDPGDPSAFDNADAVFLYMDGGSGHPVNRDLEAIGQLTARGIGLGCLHYAVEVEKGESGNRFLDWIGGYFEKHLSVNPHWTLEKTVIGDHAIARGVKPFFINDEWYFNMRFRGDMVGVTPVLTATPPPSTMRRKDGPHSGNPIVRELVRNKTPMHLAWAAERPGGGRGFGCTGGHVHWNWANDDFRKMMLNSLLWIAGAEVPANGVESSTPTRADLEVNQDYPKP